MQALEDGANDCGQPYEPEIIIASFTLPSIDSNPTVTPFGKSTGVYKKHSITATPPIIGKDLIIELKNASRSSIPVLLGIGVHPFQTPVKGPNGVRWYVGSPILFQSMTHGPKANASFKIPLAKDPYLIGFKAYAQWIYRDPCKNGWCATPAVEIKIACCGGC